MSKNRKPASASSLQSQLTRMSRRLVEERLRHQNDLDRIDEALGDVITELEFAKRRLALQKALQQEP